MSEKQQAAQAAMAYVASGMTVGLGTGSTADFFLQALGQQLRDGTLRDIRGIPTSIMSERRARELGIPLGNLVDNPVCDVTVDGADEIDPQLNLIKGLGGALLREKIIAQHTRTFIIIGDHSKTVTHLGTRSPLPVEVTQFAHEAHEMFLRGLGCQPVLRQSATGTAFVTDNGNLIYDCHFPSGISDPMALNNTLCQRAGIVESGLFLDMAALALVAGAQGVTTLKKHRPNG
ncbi:MAG: ribose-5-phosphate isomerase RpiA [Phycisphaerales bacterium]|nr:ribose-5-phosphate isomerase RpiA [Phycisphaerales bacterium]